MNSIKNLLVVVMLMGVSYGAFQVINSPDPTLSDDVPDIEELDIDIGPPLADDFSATMPGDPGALTGEAIQFAGEPSDGLPALPPGLQGAADPSTGPGLELPELEITSPPTTATSQSTTPPPAHNSGLDMPPASAMAGLPTGNSGMGFNSGQFQPGPQTELQPVNPKPLADLANRQLNQLGAAVENQASQVVDTANQLAHQQLQPARDAATELQGQMNQFNEQATEFLAKTQNQLSTGGFSPPADPSRALAPAVPPAPSADPRPATDIDWAGISELASGGQVRQALQVLSRHYESPLPADQRMQMLQWLDQLAGKVIYSTEHHLAPRPCIVADGDTLESLAVEWNVPAQLIYNINSNKIGDPALLVPGTELKVVTGPFDARISVERQEMTLFLGDLYAGRFPIELGQDHEYELGSFMIEGKSDTGRQYQDRSGQLIAAGDASNPYGKFWLGFSNSDLCIHESPAADNASDRRGCIRLSSRDAADVYGILSDGSQISITR